MLIKDLLENTGWFFVLVKDGKSKVVPENENIWDYESNGWEIVWDSARTKQAGYEYALIKHNAIPETDEFYPVLMTKPTKLYRSVSLEELKDIAEKRKILGKGNSFNPFDTRKWVFFGDEITPSLIAQGEEIERRVSVKLSDHELHKQFEEIEKQSTELRIKFIQLIQSRIENINRNRKKEGMPLITISDDVYEEAKLGWNSALNELSTYAFDKESQNVLDRIYKITDQERKLQKKYLELHKKTTSSLKKDTSRYTSAIIETKPLIGGLHYSKNHGKSGMGNMDEYGLPSGFVTVNDIVNVHMVRKGKIITSFDDIFVAIDNL